MAWKKGDPVAGRKARYIDDDIRTNNDALETAIDNEHDFTTGGTQTGRHAQGSARCFFQDAAPSTRIDGTAFTSADYGSLWIDSNSDPDNQFNVLTNHDPVTWTPVSTEIIAILVAAIHTWAAVQTFSEIPIFTKGLAANNAYLQARNAAGNGNVDLIKADTEDKAVLGVVTILPDTSALATSAAPTEDVHLPNKKYVDDQIATRAVANPFGAWVDKSAAYGAQQATTDGFIVGYCVPNATTSYIEIYTDANANPTTLRQKNFLGAGNYTSFCCPVKKNDYWKMVVTGNVTFAIYWIPLGS